MQRRAFVRLVGGGVVLGAVGGLGACSGRLPAEAIAAWQGPGAEPDLRRWILSHAILAPHSHNLQSWLVDLRTPGEMLLRCDPQRLLPETDPFSRQIMMSHGCFLELLDLAARQRGQRAQITLFPEGTYGPDQIDARPVARVRLVAEPTLAPDPLFQQILSRRTNRQVYALERPVPAPAWQALAEAVRPHPLRFGFIGSDQAGAATALQRQREVARQAWRTELVTPRTLLESYRWLRIGASEIARHRDGISITDPMLTALDRLGLFNRQQAPAPDDTAIRTQLKDFDAKIASAPGFVWLVSEGNSRVVQIEAGRAWARVQLAGTALGLAMHPLQQALQEYAEQAQAHAEIHRLLGAERPSHTVQMWARVGHAEPVEPAPRRGLDAQLVRG
ncbi:Acg family FMN-binding oxidoreductase [Aquabacterium sp. OR-4]|uniref:Acg family FMN-binding oxidoreductase n=1 Tax=Aquabacterium sp. OR-4 TaxID=2978127 RepID=UPI0021B43617|nr:twin-arginine translocation pathway signal protein [Aquabacterium sp. OR-4]MDT7837051.1 twin-arginine translocation pathway signal protein [Aquabacterium sp. OR-4]